MQRNFHVRKRLTHLPIRLVSLLTMTITHNKRQCAGVGALFNTRARSVAYVHYFKHLLTLRHMCTIYNTWHVLSMDAPSPKRGRFGVSTYDLQNVAYLEHMCTISTWQFWSICVPSQKAPVFEHICAVSNTWHSCSISAPSTTVRMLGA